MTALASGDRNFTVVDSDRGDEIGKLAEALETFRNNAAELEAMEEQRKADEQKAQEMAHRARLDLADRFEQEVGEITRIVASAATELEASSLALTDNAEEADKQSSTVAAASEESTVSLHTISDAANSLSESVNEVHRQVEQSQRISEAAVEQTDQTNATVTELDNSAQKIGEIIDLISGIAEQTNLLALNATIEAARAGEAGKGFSVVATEVKNLAGQTTRATEEIASQIKAIQGATGATVKSIGTIRETINEMRQSADVVTRAVDDQMARTSDIARGVDEAAIGGQEIAKTTNVMQSTAQTTGQSAKEVLAAAGELSSQSEKLSAAVTRMVNEIRAA
jgi:methyl-accepting chemotaxis protein